MCGEHKASGMILMRSIGSPPHVRGTHWDKIKETTETGITPACAGNTLYVQHVIRDLWDHPRMCGEHSKNSLIIYAYYFSSCCNSMSFS